MKLVFAVIACLPLLTAQNAPLAGPLLNGKETVETCTRATQLMESLMVAVPALSQAGNPLLERGRQELRGVRANTGDAAAVYSFLTNLKAYLSVTDAVPKPYPLADAAQRQFSELREIAARLETHFRALLESNERRLHTGDPDNVQRYFDADAHLAAPRAGRPRVVFLGDSITDGWPLNEYFPDRDFINRGIGGQITAQMLGRMKSDVTDLQPAAVAILGGTNDLARGVPLAAIENNLTMMCDLADQHRIHVILASLLPVSDYAKTGDPNSGQTAKRPPQMIRSLNDWMQSFCRTRGYTYLDYYSHMVDSSGFLKADLSDDGLHPNSKGYRVMAPLAQAAVDNIAAAPVERSPKRRRFVTKST